MAFPSSVQLRRLKLANVAIALALLAAPGSVAAQQPSEQAAAIAELFSSEQQNLPLPIKQESAALKSYYVDNGGAPLWSNAARMTELVTALREADKEGLEPSAYPADELAKIARLTFAADRLTRAQVELYFSALFLRFARDLKVGRFLPTKIDPKLYWQKKTIDPVRALTSLAAAQSIDAFVERWQPQIKDYRRLKAVLAAYREIAEAGGWPKVPQIETLKPGERHPAIPAIHARLESVDPELHGGRDRASDVYDQVLVGAVKRFQLSQGLEADGVLGKRTIFAMNIPVTDRIRQIIVTMERWRWMPEDLGRSYIRVNIAGYELRRVRNGKLEEKMRVVVGKPYHQTPVFSNQIKYLEFNPYWNVPHSIAVKEELPKLRANPAARQASGFEAVVDGRAVPLTAINWQSMSAGNLRVQIRQRPGPNNALGRVKFMFPNQFNVYLHDTPARSLFSRSERAFSHGCIRLARPIDLAEQVLHGVPGWDRARIDRVLASKERTVVHLTSPLPVHLTYATTWLDEHGAVQFRPDIYGRDTKLEKALIGRYPRL
jgi:L,D-transpeptidase YcbB